MHITFLRWIEITTYLGREKQLTNAASYIQSSFIFHAEGPTILSGYFCDLDKLTDSMTWLVHEAVPMYQLLYHNDVSWWKKITYNLIPEELERERGKNRRNLNYLMAIIIPFKSCVILT